MLLDTQISLAKVAGHPSVQDKLPQMEPDSPGSPAGTADPMAAAEQAVGKDKPVVAGNRAEAHSLVVGRAYIVADRIPA